MELNRTHWAFKKEKKHKPQWRDFNCRRGNCWWHVLQPWEMSGFAKKRSKKRSTLPYNSWKARVRPCFPLSVGWPGLFCKHFHPVKAPRWTSTCSLAAGLLPLPLLRLLTEERGQPLPLISLAPALNGPCTLIICVNS